jgi:mRNA interferase MazF
MVIAQGEVWWADLPDPVGSEPGFRRPVVVVQCNAFNRSRIATVVCVALTSNLRWAEAPGNVSLSARLTGLERDSVANVSQIVTLDKTHLTDRVGRLPKVQGAIVVVRNRRRARSQQRPLTTRFVHASADRGGRRAYRSTGRAARTPWFFSRNPSAPWLLFAERTSPDEWKLHLLFRSELVDHDHDIDIGLLVAFTASPRTEQAEVAHAGAVTAADVPDEIPERRAFVAEQRVRQGIDGHGIEPVGWLGTPERPGVLASEQDVPVIEVRGRPITPRRSVRRTGGPGAAPGRRARRRG